MRLDNLDPVAALAALTPGALMFVCALYFLRARSRRSLDAHPVIASVGWLALCALPALLAQAGYLAFLSGAQLSAFTVVVFPAIWWVLLGGGTVVAFFELSAQNGAFERQDTLLDNWVYFSVLAMLQLVFVTVAVSARFKEERGLDDPVVRGAGIFVAINALIAAPWPWWGT